MCLYLYIWICLYFYNLHSVQAQYVHLADGKNEMEGEASPNYPNRILHYYVTFLPNSTQNWKKNVTLTHA